MGQQVHFRVYKRGSAKSEHFSASTCTGFVFVHGVRCISRPSSPAVGPTRPLLRIYTETTVLGPDLGSDLARVLTQKQGLGWSLRTSA